MNRTNRTIEEKLAIVQQLKSNSHGSNPTSKTNYNDISHEEKNLCIAYLVIRFVICIIIFSSLIIIGTRSPEVGNFVKAMITTEENGNLIDFMSPFTYTLQENIESASDTDSSAPSEE